MRKIADDEGYRRQLDDAHALAAAVFSAITALDRWLVDERQQYVADGATLPYARHTVARAREHLSRLGDQLAAIENRLLFYQEEKEP